MRKRCSGGKRSIIMEGDSLKEAAYHRQARNRTMSSEQDAIAYTLSHVGIISKL